MSDANREKFNFTLTSQGHKMTVRARTRGAAVHLFRRLCQPVAASYDTPFSPGAVPGIPQFQPRSVRSDGWWDDVQVELLDPDRQPPRLDPVPPPRFVPRTQPGKMPEKLAAGLHPATAGDTPAWAWKPHSIGPDNGKKPIVNSYDKMGRAR